MEVDEQRVRDVNRVLRDLKQLGRPWSAEQLRRLVHVSPIMGSNLKAEFDANGDLSVDAWKAVVMKCREERRLDKEKTRKAERAQDQEDEDYVQEEEGEGRGGRVEVQEEKEAGHR